MFLAQKRAQGVGVASEIALRKGDVREEISLLLAEQSADLLLLGAPRGTTAHILGGAVMGKDDKEGVIDTNNKVFGYENMYVCDGSMISANPGVNPSLTITAITERAMSKIEKKPPIN